MTPRLKKLCKIVNSNVGKSLFIKELNHMRSGIFPEVRWYEPYFESDLYRQCAEYVIGYAGGQMVSVFSKEEKAIIAENLKRIHHSDFGKKQ